MTAPELAVVFPRASVTGGVERVALDFVRYEAARRSTVFVGEQVDEAIPHHRVSVVPTPRSWRPIAFRRAAGRELRSLRPRTTLSFGANCPPGDVYWVQSVHRAWLEDGGDVTFKGVPVPAGVRRLLLRHQVLLRLEHDYFANHRPRAVLCTSAREVDDLARLYAVPREIMHVVPNGYDPARFAPSLRDEHRLQMRSRIDASDDDIVVLMVANEWHRKGLGALLDAVAIVGDARLRVDLVGARPPTDYDPQAQRLGVRMRWHGASSDVVRFHAAADVFALPTTYEPFGLVIVEAMASGLPVVASALAGAAAAVEDGRNGIRLRDPRDPHEIAAALDALRDPDRRGAMGAAAAASVADYRWDSVFARADSIIFAS